jgi:hypothetical protein
MRVFKVLLVTVTMASSLVVGVTAGAASAAPASQMSPQTRWCC